jgi:hypothetical protein
MAYSGTQMDHSQPSRTVALLFVGHSAGSELAEFSLCFSLTLTEVSAVKPSTPVLLRVSAQTALHLREREKEH